MKFWRKSLRWNFKKSDNFLAERRAKTRVGITDLSVGFQRPITQDDMRKGDFKVFQSNFLWRKTFVDWNVFLVTWGWLQNEANTVLQNSIDILWRA